MHTQRDTHHPQNNIRHRYTQLLMVIKIIRCLCLSISIGILRFGNPRSISRISNAVRTLMFENQVDEKVLYSQYLEGVYEDTDELIKQILEKLTKK